MTGTEAGIYFCDPPPETWFALPVKSSLGEQQNAVVDLFRALVAQPYDPDATVAELWTVCKKMGHRVWPFVAIFAAGMLAWLPLWISRCCAHRCCVPSSAGPSRRWTRGCTFTFFLLFLAIFCTAVVGVCACFDFLLGVQTTVCTSAESVVSLDNKLIFAAAELNKTATEVDSVSHAVEQLYEQLVCLEETVSTLCDTADGMKDAANALESYVGETASYPTLEAAVSDVRRYCAFARGLIVFVPELGAACQVVADSLKDIAEPLLLLYRTTMAISGMMKDFKDEIDYAAENAYPKAKVAVAVACAFLFFGPLVVNVAAAVAVGVASSRDVLLWARWRAPSVQVIGVSWVFASFSSVWYILAGALVLFVSAGLYGVGGTFHYAGANFVEVFNNTRVCEGPIPPAITAPLDFGDPGEVCYLLGVTTEACVNGENYARALLATLGYEDVAESLAARMEEMQADVAQATKNINGKYAAVIDEMANLSDSFTPGEERLKLQAAGDGLVAGCPAASATAVEALTDELIEVELAARRHLHVMLVCLVDTKQLLVEMLSVYDKFLNIGIKALEAIDKYGRCPWFKTTWTTITVSLYNTADAPFIFAAVGLLMVGLLSMLYVPAAIAMQVLYGGVGKEPGCPSRCRGRCCFAGARRRSSHTGKREEQAHADAELVRVHSDTPLHQGQVGAKDAELVRVWL